MQNISMSQQTLLIEQAIKNLQNLEMDCVRQQRYLDAEKIKHEIIELRKQQNRGQSQLITRMSIVNQEQDDKANNLKIEQFKMKWDELIQQLISQFTRMQQQTAAKHKQQQQKLRNKLKAQKKQNVKPIPDIIDTHKKINYYVKNREYVQAQELKKKLNQKINIHQQKQDKQYQQKIQLKLRGLKKKQQNQLKVLQIKFEQVLNAKVKQRNQTLQMLVKRCRKQKIAKSYHNSKKNRKYQPFNSRRNNTSMLMSNISEQNILK